MTSVTLDPALRPIRVITEAEMRTALVNVIEAERAHAEKLERMNLWAEARMIRRGIADLQAVRHSTLPALLAEALSKETANGR